MKRHLAIALAATTLVCSAQEGFQAPAVVSDKDKGTLIQIWLVAATKTKIRYRQTERATTTKDDLISTFGALYIIEPEAYAKASDLYESRKYKEAKEAFAQVKEQYKPIAALPNNPSVMAAFYEMECMRHLGEYEELSKTMSTFIKDALTIESHLRQLELYVLWDALRSESWSRLDVLCRERDQVKLPADQRTQVAYLHGRALQGLERNKEALFAYNAAMVADAGASEILARDAAIRIMQIHKADPQVQQAIKVWGTPDEEKNSNGRFHLQEAGAVAALYQLGLGAGQPLPSDLQMFLKYKPESN